MFTGKRMSVTSTDLYFVPKAVALGDAMSVCSDGTRGEDPTLHHMITVENIEERTINRNSYIIFTSEADPY